MPEEELPTEERFFGDTPEHRKYVDSGGCASVSDSKAWCNHKAMPRHKVHQAPYFQNPTESIMFYWTDFNKRARLTP